MIFKPSLRAVLTLVLSFTTCVLVAHGTARAVSEFCPASASNFQHVGDATDGLYSFAISAEGSRSVSGTIVVKTDTGWFKVPFPAVQLIRRENHLKDAYIEFTRSAFASAPLYVRFPQPVNIVAWFVSDARTTGDAYFGWDAQGDVECSPPAGFGIPPVGKAKAAEETLKILNPRTDMELAPSPGASIIAASVTAVPGSLDCKTPFSDATIPYPEKLLAPLGQNIATQVLVTVIIDATGAVADAWVYAPSGYSMYDDAALDTAKHSKYKAGSAFCKPAPGRYLFIANFNRRP